MRRRRSDQSDDRRRAVTGALLAIVLCLMGEFVWPKAGNATPVQAASSSCNEATDAGYSIRVNGQTFQVKQIVASDGRRIHLFYDENGIIVTEPNLLQRLAAATWAVEKVLLNPSALNERRMAELSLEAIEASQNYAVAQDVLARSLVEALAAYLTGGVSLTTAPARLTSGTLIGHLSQPKTWLLLWAQTGLEESLKAYDQLEAKLQRTNDSPFDETDLQEIKALYLKANGLSSSSAGLAATLLPRGALDLISNALASMKDELLANLPRVLTLKDLVDVQEKLAFAVDVQDAETALRPYDGLKQAFNVAKVAASEIENWAEWASEECLPAVEWSQVLDQKYPGWRFAGVSEAILEYFRKEQVAFQPSLIWGDFDGDGMTDYAAMIAHPGPAREERMVIALLRRGNTFEDRVLKSHLDPYISTGSIYLWLFRNGEEDFDYHTRRYFRYQNDSIGVSSYQCCGVSFVFENGAFRWLVTSD